MTDIEAIQRNRMHPEGGLSRGDEQEDSSEDLDEDALTPTAPRYSIPQRRLTAVEVPAVVQNVDRAIKAFGRNSALSHVSIYSCIRLPLMTV